MNLAEELLGIEGPNARWTLQSYESELPCPESKSFFLRDPRRITAFVLYRVFPDGIEIMNLAVREKGQGHGKKLLQDFLSSLKVGSLSPRIEVRLEVSSLNKAALALYKGLGFAEYHRRPRYYQDGSDAVLMKVSL
jgi:[ribosomal protein S18]-alanine N-acetyltransferase